MTMTVEDDFRQAQTVRNLRAKALGWITQVTDLGDNTQEDAQDIEAIIEAYKERKEEIRE